MDHVVEALQVLKAAQADVPAAEERARQVVADARHRIDVARDKLAKTIAAEYQRGARVGDLARRSEYSRETIRRILRAAGIEAD
ncbi:hypothetical protein Raf01_52430 [Rugosimonospora africana]|uniref:Homeodomain-like domain-containing protein n=1 Tax=Rugosimonospora africana TaxID=556532 RepID=A0A8J3QV58_9ACTN|nr:hypothetical protein Raf01_52430 [Rugosimonospora africana]